MFRVYWVVFTLALAAPALAVEPAQSAEVKKHVEAGVEHYDAGRYAEASREFEIAYRLSGKAGLLFNIARAETKLGHEEQAIAFLKRYLEELPDAPDAAAVAAEVEARQKALGDAKARKQAEAEAEAARKKASELEMRAAADRERDRLAVIAEQSRSRAAESKATAKKAGIALVAIGPALLVVGIGLGAGAMLAAREVEGMSNTEYGTCCFDLESRGQTMSAVGITFDVLGGVSAAVGAGVLGWSLKK